MIKYLSLHRQHWTWIIGGQYEFLSVSLSLIRCCDEKYDSLWKNWFFQKISPEVETNIYCWAIQNLLFKFNQKSLYIHCHKSYYKALNIQVPVPVLTVTLWCLLGSKLTSSVHSKPNIIEQYYFSLYMLRMYIVNLILIV